MRSFVLKLPPTPIFVAAGRLDKSNNISWRSTSGLRDGRDAIGGPASNLSGGYYDAGDNIKFGFPGAYAMTLLSWSVIEYKAKYEAAGELDHIKKIIKWGTDYMLKTFNYTSPNVDYVFAQVCVYLILRCTGKLAYFGQFYFDTCL